MSRATISNHFTGIALALLYVLVGLARVLGVDPGWLAFGGESAVASPPELDARVEPTKGS